MRSCLEQQLGAIHYILPHLPFPDCGFLHVTYIIYPPCLGLTLLHLPKILNDSDHNYRLQFSHEFSSICHSSSLSSRSVLSLGEGLSMPPQNYLSRAVLFDIVSLQYSSRSSLRRLAGLPCRRNSNRHPFIRSLSIDVTLSTLTRHHFIARCCSRYAREYRSNIYV